MKTREPFIVKCGPCGHVWIGIYVPIALAAMAKLLGSLCCPSCAAGADQIFSAEGLAPSGPPPLQEASPNG